MELKIHLVRAVKKHKDGKVESIELIDTLYNIQQILNDGKLIHELEGQQNDHLKKLTKNYKIHEINESNGYYRITITSDMADTLKKVTKDGTQIKNPTVDFLALWSYSCKSGDSLYHTPNGLFTFTAFIKLLNTLLEMTDEHEGFTRLIECPLAPSNDFEKLIEQNTGFFKVKKLEEKIKMPVFDIQKTIASDKEKQAANELLITFNQTPLSNMDQDGTITLTYHHDTKQTYTPADLFSMLTVKRFFEEDNDWGDVELEYKDGVNKKGKKWTKTQLLGVVQKIELELDHNQKKDENVIFPELEAIISSHEK